MRNHPVLHVSGLLLSLFLLLAMTGPQTALAQNKPASPASPPMEKPSGTVHLTIGQGGLVIGASGGSGTLTFRNATYPIELGGLGIGEIGAAKVVCEGEVYNLSRIEDFSGVYGQLEGGYAGMKGKGELWLKNTKGVKMRLHSNTQGLELTASAEGVVIKLKEGKK